jgi:hypothetical protein
MYLFIIYLLYYFILPYPFYLRNEKILACLEFYKIFIFDRVTLFSENIIFEGTEICQFGIQKLIYVGSSHFFEMQ